MAGRLSRSILQKMDLKKYMTVPKLHQTSRSDFHQPNSYVRPINQSTNQPKRLQSTANNQIFQGLFFVENMSKMGGRAQELTYYLTVFNRLPGDLWMATSPTYNIMYDCGYFVGTNTSSM